MKNLAAAALALSACAGPVAAGQGGQPPSTPAQTRPVPPADGSTVTVTGCLRAAEQPGTFVLEKIRWSEPSAGGTTNGVAHHDAAPERDRPKTPATVTQKDGVIRPDTLRLAGAAANSKLAAHAGHTVTLTGMLMPRDPVVRPGVLLPDAPAPGDTTSRRAEQNPKDDAAAPRVLNVRNVTHVAAGCK